MPVERIYTSEPYFRALRGERVSFEIGAEAVAGYWKARYPDRQRGTMRPVSIVAIRDVDEGGELVADETFEAFVAGAQVPVSEVWPWCGRHPIKAEEYDAMTHIEADASPLAQLPAKEAPRVNATPDAMHSPDIGELAGALAKAQGAILGAAKDTANPFFKSAYADLASVWGACRAALSNNGLAVAQTTRNNPDTVTVVTTLMHSSGQWMRGELSLRPVKSDPQGVGSAITYARRYALAAMVGVAPEDDDGEAAMGRRSTPERVAPPPPSKSANGRTDDKLAKATEWANGLAVDLDKSKVAGYVTERLAEPETVARLKWLYEAHNDVWAIVERARERAIERIVKP